MSVWAEYAPAVTAAFGTVVGLLIGRRMRPRPPDPVRPICTCGHGYGSHQDGKECQVGDREADHWDSYGREDHWVSVQCSCTRYDGPDPAIFGMAT